MQIKEYIQHLKTSFDKKFHKCENNWAGGRLKDANEDDIMGRRYCTVCGRDQIMVYKKFGAVRYEWIDSPQWQVKKMKSLK